MTDSNCIFCKIVAREVPCYEVWSDATHLAFLTPFPNTEGVTVVIPKNHEPSDVFAAAPEVRASVVEAAATVAMLLEQAFPDVGRVGLVFEGMGVDHLHAKLFPMHGTAMEEWRPIESVDRQYSEQYQGFLATNDFHGVPAEQIEATLAKIRAAKPDRS